MKMKTNGTSIGIMVATIAVILGVGFADPHDWQCYSEMAAPLRRSEKAIDPECITWNGGTCVWQWNVLGCQNVLKMVSNPAYEGALSTLGCGPDMYQKTGMTGYEDDSLWCRRAYGILPHNDQPVGDWTCGDNLHAPMRVNRWGVVECMALDRKECIWEEDPDQCQALITNPPAAVFPLDCKAQIAIWGPITPDHWCVTASAFFGVAVPTSS